MKVTQIEKLNQLISRTDMTGNQKVEWLTNFIDEHVTEQLRLNDVSVSFDKGYDLGYKDATSEACKEIEKNYRPNER